MHYNMPQILFYFLSGTLDHADSTLVALHVEDALTKKCNFNILGIIQLSACQPKDPKPFLTLAERTAPTTPEQHNKAYAENPGQGRYTQRR